MKNNGGKIMQLRLRKREVPLQTLYQQLNNVRLSPCVQYLLSDNEIKIKTALWMAENSDYLKEQKGTESIQAAMREKIVFFNFIN